MSHKLRPSDLNTPADTGKSPFNTVFNANETGLDVDIKAFNVDQQLAHSRIFPRSK